MRRSRTALLGLLLAATAGCVSAPQAIVTLPGWTHNNTPSTFPGTAGPTDVHVRVSRVRPAAQERLFGRSAEDEGVLPIRIEIENARDDDVRVDLATSSLTRADGSTVELLPMADIRERLSYSHARALWGLPLVVPVFILWARVTDANDALAERLDELASSRRVAPRRFDATPPRVTTCYAFFPARDETVPVRLTLTVETAGETHVLERTVQTGG